MKIPKPQRARKGKTGKYVGNYFIKDPADGHQINLGTKNATEALARAKEFATTGKRNFQDDLDGAAEATLAAVEAAPATPTAGIEAPAAPAATLASAGSPIAAQPAPAALPAPEQQPAQQPPLNNDWRVDAQMAAEKAAASSDSTPAKPIPQLIDPNMIDQFVKTGAGFLFSGQVYMQGKAIEWWTGEKVPPVLPTIERAVKAGGMPQEALDGITQVRALSIAGYESFLRRKLPLDNLPDYAVGLIAAGSLASVQYSIAAATKAQKAEAKKRGGAPLGMPAGTPAAPPPAATEESENGVGAEAL